MSLNQSSIEEFLHKLTQSLLFGNRQVASLNLNGNVALWVSFPETDNLALGRDLHGSLAGGQDARSGESCENFFSGQLWGHCCELTRLRQDIIGALVDCSPKRSAPSKLQAKWARESLDHFRWQ